MGKLRTFLLEKLPWIVTVLGIICWTYYCHVLVMDADLLTSKNGGVVVLGVVDVVCFTTIFVLTVSSYYQILSTSPGYVPLPEDVEAGGGQASHAVGVMMQAMSTGPGQDRKTFCTKCNVDRPDRAHHCKLCKRCVLKMDHHCPWVGNCVGLRNHKFFALFIWYTTVLALYNIVAISIWGAQRSAAEGSDSLWGNPSWQVVWANVIVSGIFELSLFGFSWYHCWLLSHNMTTLESLNRDKSHSLGSIFNNLSFNLGHHPGLWCLPCWGIDDCLKTAPGGNYNPVSALASGTP
mmetsp:Transcript_32739/g.77584  ORF Transcript_32739/g.77584 Transcript_32739/m.77584 type:complete len:292 (-) Transcript_32739:58-933(-)